MVQAELSWELITSLLMSNFLAIMQSLESAVGLQQQKFPLETTQLIQSNKPES